MDQPLDKIEEQLSTLNAQKELHNWNPKLSGDIDIRIAANGEWFHEGSKIQRPQLIKLFSSILRREKDDHYYLVTPVEKWRIQVEDAPLMVIDIEVCDAGSKQQRVQFTLNNDDTGLLNQQHALRVENNDDTGEPSPYIDLPNRLFAKFTRASFYHLVEQCEMRDSEMGLFSDGCWQRLGSVE